MGVFKKANGLVKKLKNVDVEALGSGVYHYKFRNKTIEKLKDERAPVCDGCEFKEVDDYEPIKDEDKRIDGMMCGSCFCSLPYLLRQIKKSCKEGKWK